MTSQGSVHARFRRAVATGNPLIARAAAAEVGRLGLEDALALVLVLLSDDGERYERAAVRWVSRLCLERPGIGLDEAGLALRALGALRGAGMLGAARALEALCERHGLSAGAQSVRSFASAQASTAR